MESREAMRFRGAVLLVLGLALLFILRYIGGAWSVASSIGLAIVLVVFGGPMLIGQSLPDDTSI